MTEPTVHEPELLAVFPNAEHAHDARIALIEAGVPEASIRVDDAADTVSALRAEQADEISRAWVVPNAGVVYPGSSARGLSMVSVAAAVVVVPAAMLLALIDFGPDYWVRALIFVAVGLALALTVGLVVGPSAGAPAPAEPPAAAQGTTLRVSGDSERLRRLLGVHDPIRVSVVTSDDVPVDTVAHQRPDSARETLKDMAARTDGDDFHPPR